MSSVKRQSKYRTLVSVIHVMIFISLINYDIPMLGFYANVLIN